MDDSPIFTRRELLKRVTVVGTAVAIPVRFLTNRGAVGAARQNVAPSVPEVFETLTAVEAETLTAVVARLIPTDESGPGATEARSAYYIDRALSGALAPSREAYRTGLAAIDRFAQTSRRAAFARLPAAEQDAVLRAIEANDAPGFQPNAVSFFNLLLAHTIQGTFGDPYYGGNANFVGWDLIGYPGVRLTVAAAEQRIEARPAPTHRSAYDHAMFSKKKPARASRDAGGHHHAG